MQARLTEIATAARAFITPVWREWHAAWGDEQPSIASQNTCGRTSLFLVTVLRHEAIDAQWKTGVPRPAPEGPELGPYGVLVNGRWESHAWVEAAGWIIDITADQFGAPPVIITPIGDNRYRPGDEDTALPRYIANRQKAVDDIWPRWTNYRAARLRA